MPRPAVSEAERHTQAVQAARRMVSRGERPGYRLAGPSDGRYGVDGLPGVTVAAPSRRTALEPMRAAIAAALDMPADTFDVEA